MGAWEQLRGELATATSRDFERKVLPLLQVFWPSIVRPPDMDHLDRSGIDLLVHSDTGRFPCVVQCKGLYSTEDLGYSHYEQIKESVISFKNSKYSCNEYILLHNRTGKNSNIVKKIQSELASLIPLGKAKSVRLWDRQTFVRDFRERFKETLLDRLRQASQDLLEGTLRLFAFGHVYVPTVNVSEHQITLRRGGLPQIVQIRPSAEQSISRLILSPTTTRWTLLTGQFGTGKSLAALHAAVSKASSVIYARCSDMGPDRGGVGTNVLLQRIASSIRLFDDFGDEARERLERFAGPTLRESLCTPDCTSILVLDGLDENRTFSTPAGMASLSSVLAELRCSIVLTTRDSHFNATFGNFDNVFDEFSLKGGAARTARRFHLEAWQERQVKQFLKRVFEEASPVQRPRIQELSKQFSSGQTHWPTELFFHPLFLQMIVELAADGAVATQYRGETIRQWLYRKISRDLEVDRPLPISVTDRTSFIEQMLQLMENVAGRMIQESPGAVTLTEDIDSEIIVTEAKRVFGAESIDIASVVATSVLEPVSQRRKASVPIKFSHRSFQEYFLARYIRSHHIDPRTYPAPVREFYGEMA